MSNVTGAGEDGWWGRSLAGRLRAANTEAAYGLVLITLTATITFDLAAPETRWAAAVQTLLGAVALATTLVITRASRGMWVVLAALVAAAVAVSVLRGVDAVGGNTVSRLGALLTTALVLVVVARDLVRHPRITVRTLLGGIAVYLLIGLVFARLYAFLASVDSGRFFAQPGNDSPADYLYFSYITQATVGFGDLTPGTRIGRAFTIGNALIGQLYLVTVVALVVSNIGRERTPPSGRDESRPQG